MFRHFTAVDRVGAPEQDQTGLMLKLLGEILMCVCLAAPAGLSQDNERVMYLHLERDSAGVRLLKARAVPGRVKADARFGSIEFHTLNEAGQVIFAGSCADPLVQNLEYPDPVEPGILRGLRVERERVELVVRVPAVDARKVRFFHRGGGAEKMHRQGSRKLIGEIEIPAETDPRVHAFHETAKVSMISSNGLPGMRVNIVFLAEGYRQDQETNFEGQAKSVLSQMMNASPYKEYKNHFNAFVIFVPSVEAGSDHPSRGIFRDTYFNSSYGVGALERLITIPPNNWNSNFGDGVGKVFELLPEFVPGYDIPLLLVNDSEYGGSGGVPAIASANALSAELALHEIGHSFAGLADEYEEELTGYPDVEAANTTRETRRDWIKWGAWISEGVPVPTPETALYQNVIGLFEGAYFHPTGWYRPKLDCRMRNLSKPFCEVCRETHLLTIYSLVDAIPSSWPTENNLTVPGGGELDLRVDTVNPAQGLMGYTWTIDGMTNEGVTGKSFSASFATIGTGTHLVRVTVWDPTGFVRNDPSGKLSESRSWLVTVVAPTNVPPTISDVADVILELPQQSSGIARVMITDPDTPFEAVTFSVSSSNPELLPNDKIYVVGDGFERELQILPTPGMIGVSTVTVRVRDGTTEVEESFQVVVSDIKTDLMLAPLADHRVFSGPLEVALLVSRTSTNDLHFSGDSSNPAVLPNTGISFAESAGETRLQLRPEAGAMGETRISVSVTDGVEVAEREFTVEFVARPTVTSNAPRITSEGIRIDFTSDIPAAMILEYSTDLTFWTPVASSTGSTELTYVAAETENTVAGFYRVRVPPL